MLGPCRATKEVSWLCLTVSSWLLCFVLQPATKQFAKSPVERHLSLQERKRALYDYARR